MRDVDRENEVHRILGAFKLNPFEQLGLRFDASVDDVKKAYRKSSLMVHPDKCKHPKAQDAFEALGQAQQQLNNEEKMKELLYVLTLAQGVGSLLGKPPVCAFFSFELSQGALQGVDFVTDDNFLTVCSLCWVSSLASHDSSRHESCGQSVLLTFMLCYVDHVLKEWRKKTKNDAATRLASVLHAVSSECI